MYMLNNDDLSVQILDPITDVAREGSRYCTGGYIWQVTHPVKGALFTGPEWPSLSPNTFDGQGAPDMFFTPLNADTAQVGDLVGVIGVGEVLRTDPNRPFDVRFDRTTANFVTWNVEAAPTTLKMTTRHTFQDWSYALSREVWLEGNTVYSRTSIQSLGTAVLPVKWFAHPFFPVPNTPVMCRFDPAVTIADNPGFAMDADGWITRTADHKWQWGQYQALEFSAGAGPLTVVQQHPAVGKVTVHTDWTPDFLPIWGNAVTFSFEPYVIRNLAQNEQAAWTISYTFG